MKVVSKSVGEIKTKVETLKGQKVDMCVNKGRRQMIKFSALIVETYPCVFIVEAFEPCPIKTMSYSYSEVLCGNVRIRPQV